MAKILAFKTTTSRAPKIVLRKVTAPGRRKDKAIGRTRSHLTPTEVKALIHAAGDTGRHRKRDELLVLVAYRHGLRVSELIELRWDAVDFDAKTLHVARLKNGTPATHPIAGDEIRALRALQKASGGSRYVFTTERGGPLTRSTVSKIVARAGELAKIPFPVTPHQLRHACGFNLANQDRPTREIQAYLGHKAIQHTVRYTALSDKPFRKIVWD